MNLTPSQHLALTLRRRPLLLPLLTATLCVDLLLLIRYSEGYRFAGQSLYHHFMLLGQTGLLALWTASSARWWAARLGASLAAVAVFSLEPPTPTVNAETLAWHCLYFAMVLVVEVGLRVARYARGRQGRPLQFQTRHLLIAMTITAGLGGVLRTVTDGGAIPTGGDAAFLAALLAALTVMPFFSRWVARRASVSLLGVTAAFVACMALAGGLGWMMSRLTGGAFSASLTALLGSVGAVSTLWFLAANTPPDPRERRAARRRRRAAQAPTTEPAAIRLAPLTVEKNTDDQPPATGGELSAAESLNIQA